MQVPAVRSRWVAALGTACALGAAVAGTQGDEAQRVLAAARQAMGGEAALAAVKAFTVSGNAERNLGEHVASQSVEIACELPDRFVRVVTYDAAFGAPAGLSLTLTHRDGFNGAGVIRETTTMGDRTPPPPPSPVAPPRTPEEKEARERAFLASQKQPFARLILALFAASFPSFPLEFTSAGHVRLPDGTTADAVDAKGPNEFTLRLLVDATTHLPAMIIWHEKPVVIVRQTTITTTTTTSTGIAPLRTPPPPTVPPPPPPRPDRNVPLPPGTVLLDSLPSGDPTAALPLVEHRLSLSDYRVADGLNWPHRLTDRVDGQVLEDVKLGRFRLNPRIPTSKFRTGR